MKPTLRLLPPSPEQRTRPEAPYVAIFAGPSEVEVVRRAAAALHLRAGEGAEDEAVVVATRSELWTLTGALQAGRARLAARALESALEPLMAWRLRTRSLPLDRPQVMGVLNLTDDSFSGDGVGTDITSALRRADRLRADGAALIDAGAETARADRPVRDAAAEARLMARVVTALVREGHVVSADTYKPEVARAALDAGAEAINDISGLTLGTAAASEAARSGAGYVLNYSFSVPKQRPDSPPAYTDVVTETVAWMEERLTQLEPSGLHRDAIAIDPGIAFGKSHDEDLQVLRRLGELRTPGLPLLLAHSRKNFIGSMTGRAPDDRDLETHAVSVLAYAAGARIFRVHDVAGAHRALAVAAALVDAAPGAFAPDDGSWPWTAGASASHMTRSNADKAAPPGQRW